LASADFINWVERRGLSLRRILNLGPLDVLDPERLAQKMGIPIYTPYDIEGLSPEILTHLLSSDGWSAGSLPLQGGKWVILINPTHPPTRNRATLMEELSHIYLGHPPSKIENNNGFMERSYKKTHETQAYWVGAAALLPSTLMSNTKARGMSRHLLATGCGVSEDLVKFRENVTGIKLVH